MCRVSPLFLTSCEFATRFISKFTARSYFALLGLLPGPDACFFSLGLLSGWRLVVAHAPVALDGRTAFGALPVVCAPAGVGFGLLAYLASGAS